MNELDKKVLSYLERELKRARTAEKADLSGENTARAHEVENVKMVVENILFQKPVFTFEKVEEDAKMPHQAHPGDAGFDVFAQKEEEIAPSETKVIKIGLKCHIPKNWEIQVRGRSGLATQGLLVVNSPGTIDSTYRGEIGVILHNLTKETKKITKHMKIAQLIFSPVCEIEIREGTVDSNTQRGNKGFGSTGI
jgi:dUTP pyrophosphatase